MVAKIFAVCVLATLVCAEKVRYDNFGLYKIVPENEEQVVYLKKLHESENGYEFWKAPSAANDFFSVVSPPELKEDLELALKKRSIRSEVMLENIQEAFDAQVFSRKKRDDSRNLYWTGYQTLDAINEWFEYLSDTYPGVVTVIMAGQSFEGRNITGIKISRHSQVSQVRKRAFILEGGSVGADWLSPVVVTYIANQLLTSTDEAARQASEDFDWYFFPVSNPDGFEFSQDSVRLWTKSRRPQRFGAVGVDLSKNWNSQWGVSGGSHVPTAVNYIGLGPFSEPETRALSDYIGSIEQNFAGFLSFRSFGQRLVLPFAHSTVPMYNYNEMVVVGRRAMGSLAVKYGTQYLVGTSQAVSDGSTGSITDWAKHRFNPPIAATYMLRDTGAWGYTLPVAQVFPTCEETFDSLLAIIREARHEDLL